MLKIVITGGTGFIGSHIAEGLAKNGHEIVIVDNLDPYYSIDLKQRNIDLVLKNGDANFIQADVKDLGRMKEIIDSTVDYIYHKAAQAGVRISVDDPFLRLITNSSSDIKFSNKQKVMLKIHFQTFR